MAVGAGLLVTASGVSAQFGSFRSRGLPMATRDSFDGAYQFCRAAFRGIQRGDGGGWTTDYPDADLKKQAEVHNFLTNTTTGGNAASSASRNAGRGPASFGQGDPTATGRQTSARPVQQTGFQQPAGEGQE